MTIIIIYMCIPIPQIEMEVEKSKEKLGHLTQ